MHRVHLAPYELYTKCHLRVRSEAGQVVKVIRFDPLLPTEIGFQQWVPSRVGGSIINASIAFSYK